VLRGGDGVVADPRPLRRPSRASVRPDCRAVARSGTRVHPPLGGGPCTARARRRRRRPRRRRVADPEGERMTFYQDMVSNGREHPEPLVRVDRADDRAVVTLDDPAKLNTLSAPLVQQLKAALEELCSDQAIRAIVLTRADPGFAAGGDLRMMRDAPAVLASPEAATDIWRWIRYEFGGIVRLIARSDTAFIAAINGAAAGVGLAWALTGDLALASERARVLPPVRGPGLLPRGGTSLAI